MVAVRKTVVTPEGKTISREVNPNDPNVRDPEHAHELGGTLGMTAGGVAAGIAAGVAAASTAAVTIPVGAAVIAGAALGGALGGRAGEDIAREVNPTLEEEYWEENYRTRDYVREDASFETYRPAYRYGVEAYRANPTRSFDDLEPSLRNNWGADTGIDWEEARHAARDAFTRASESRTRRS